LVQETISEPSFEQRITALEKALCEELDALLDRMVGVAPYRKMMEGIAEIGAVCAIARDYARRPEGE